MFLSCIAFFVKLVMSLYQYTLNFKSVDNQMPLVILQIVSQPMQGKLASREGSMESCLPGPSLTTGMPVWRPSLCLPEKTKHTDSSMATVATGRVQGHRARWGVKRMGVQMVKRWEFWENGWCYVRKKVIANNRDLVEELAFNTFWLIKES